MRAQPQDCLHRVQCGGAKTEGDSEETDRAQASADPQGPPRPLLFQRRGEGDPHREHPRNHGGRMDTTR